MGLFSKVKSAYKKVTAKGQQLAAKAVSAVIGKKATQALSNVGKPKTTAPTQSYAQYAAQNANASTALRPGQYTQVSNSKVPGLGTSSPYQSGSGVKGSGIGVGTPGTSNAVQNLFSKNLVSGGTTGTTRTTTPTLDKADAPTSVSNIKSMSSPTVPSGTPGANISGLGGNADASAYIAGTGAEDGTMKGYTDKELEARLLRIQDESKKEESFLDQYLENKTTREEERERAEREMGISRQEYFAERERDRAEYNTMAQQLGQVEAARDSQILQTQDKMGSMNFINNQTQQIIRNAAPQVYELNAKMSAKAAYMSAKAEDFAEAQKMVAQSVEYAMADQKDDLDLMKEYREINKDLFNQTESAYKDAFDKKFSIMQEEYKQQEADKKWMLEMGLENNVSVDPIKDTPQSVANRIVASGGTLTSRIQRQQLANAQLDYRLKSSEGSGAPKIYNINGTDMIWDGKNYVPAPVGGATKGGDAHLQSQAIEEMESLIDHKGLNNAVGTRWMGRLAPFEKGRQEEFIGKTDQIIRSLTLDTYAQAKEKGMTFGAMSDAEWRILGQKATALDSYRLTNKKGRTIGFAASEQTVKAELQKIIDEADYLYQKNFGTPRKSGEKEQLNAQYREKIKESLLEVNNPILQGGY